MAEKTLTRFKNVTVVDYQRGSGGSGVTKGLAKLVSKNAKAGGFAVFHAAAPDLKHDMYTFWKANLARDGITKIAILGLAPSRHEADRDVKLLHRKLTALSRGGKFAQNDVTKSRYKRRSSGPGAEYICVALTA